MREGKLKSVYGPYRARDYFGLPLRREDGPIWTFDRDGATRTGLPDGRSIFIGGEHEDFYDPDFCIYNDVIVFGKQDQIEIFGYPEAVFPPTDFHTACLTTGRIIIVGGLGYPDKRRPGHTPVYELELSNYQISEIKTEGDKPGWIFKHSASLDSTGLLILRGGELFEEKNGNKRYRRNVEEYALDLGAAQWTRLTDRNWQQFSIRSENGALFVRDRCPDIPTLVPSEFRDAICRESHNRLTFLVDEIPLSIKIGVLRIEILVEGKLPERIVIRLIEQIRTNAETAAQLRCLWEEL